MWPKKHLLSKFIEQCIFYNDFFSIIVGLPCSVNFLLYSKVTQLHIHVCILFLTLYAPPQVTRHSSQCDTAESHCLSIPKAIVCIYPRFPVHPTPSSSFLPFGNHKSVLHICDCLFCGKVHLCRLLDSRYK